MQLIFLVNFSHWNYWKINELLILVIIDQFDLQHVIDFSSHWCHFYEMIALNLVGTQLVVIDKKDLSGLFDGD